MKGDAKLIDALLPQTQCQQCGYQGCLPYAKAISEQGEQINKCVPGGLDTLKSLGALLNVEVAPLKAELLEKTKPTVVARIIEDLCIGCTKCIQACPVDAIIGASKQMHTVFTDECTGCELCIEPCPMDCIELVVVAPPTDSTLPDKRRQRFQQRQARLTKLEQEKIIPKDAESVRKDYIAQALLRAQAKK